MADFVLCGNQIDDLPEFGKIKDILLVGSVPMLYVEKYLTEGINNHLMCHTIVRSHKFEVKPISSLVDYTPYSAHTYIGDGQLHIAMRTDVISHCFL